MIRVLIALLLLPLTAFGTITATSRGVGTDNTSSTNVTINFSVLSGTMTAGNIAVIIMAMDNANSAGANIVSGSYTDNCSPPNTWYVRSDGVAAGTANLTQELVILTSNLVTNVTTSNSLTITLSVASTAEAWTITEASTNVSGAYVMYGNGLALSTTSVNTATPSISTNFEPSNGDLAIGCGAAEGSASGVDTWAADSVNTTGGAWTNFQHTGIGTTTSGMSVVSQTKVVSVYGAQTFAPTLTLADTRMGWLILTEADAKARSVSGNSTSSTTITVPVSYPITAGSLAVLCVAADNAGGASINIPVTPTDAWGNTWTKQLGAAYNISGANTGVENAVYIAPITTGLAAGSNITIATASASIAAKTWVLWEFRPSGAGTVTVVTGNNGSGSTTTTPTITTGGTITNGNYIVAMIGAEGFNTFTADADTSNGSWKTLATAGKGASTGVSISIMSQWKQVTATAGQTFNSVITSADTISGYIELNDSSSTGPTAQQKAAFFMLFP